jgi:hypothetical protein
VDCMVAAGKKKSSANVKAKTGGGVGWGSLNIRGKG